MGVVAVIAAAWLADLTVFLLVARRVDRRSAAFDVEFVRAVARTEIARERAERMVAQSSPDAPEVPPRLSVVR